jgi:hypothetical protein
MLIQNDLSTLLFLILLFTTYIVMWVFIRKYKVKKSQEKDYK